MAALPIDHLTCNSPALDRRIKPQGWVRKIEASRSPDDVFSIIQAAATAYAAAGGDAAAQRAALAPLDRLWVDWAPTEDTAKLTTYKDAAAGETGALEERSAFPDYHDDGATAFGE